MRELAQIGAVLLCAILIGCDDSNDGGSAGADADGGFDAATTATGGNGAAGTGTGRTGTGGMGTGGVMAPFVKPSFRAHLEGRDVILETTGQAWARTCSGSISIKKRTASGWTSLRDESPRPSAGHIDDYYFDGKYVPARNDWNGCDVIQCAAFAKSARTGRAEEYVKTGTKPRPASAGLPARDIDVIQTRAYHGELAVSLRYSEWPDCSGNETALVPVMGARDAEDAGTDDAGADDGGR